MFDYLKRKGALTFPCWSNLWTYYIRTEDISTENLAIRSRNSQNSTTQTTYHKISRCKGFRFSSIWVVRPVAVESPIQRAPVRILMFASVVLWVMISFSSSSSSSLGEQGRFGREVRGLIWKLRDWGMARWWDRRGGDRDRDEDDGGMGIEIEIRMEEWCANSCVCRNAQVLSKCALSWPSLFLLGSRCWSRIWWMRRGPRSRVKIRKGGLDLVSLMAGGFGGRACYEGSECFCLFWSVGDKGGSESEWRMIIHDCWLMIDEVHAFLSVEWIFTYKNHISVLYRY